MLAPPPDPRQAAQAAALALARIDGLVLQGGGDVGREAPASAAGSGGDVECGDPERTGAVEPLALRDAFETALLEGAVARALPVLGICRGLQLINVALGGSLLDEVAGAELHGARHADPASYDRHRHAVELEPGGRLATLYGRARGSVSSAHRQGIDRIAGGLCVEARCPDDGLVEALRASRGYVTGVQWHPEFLSGARDELDGGTLFADLVREAARR